MDDEEAWRHLVTDVVDVCFDVVAVVAPIVNNSSPEGYAPEWYSSEGDRSEDGSPLGG